MITRNPDIPYGKERWYKRHKWMLLDEDHPNALIHSSVFGQKKCHSTHRDNNGISYNGEGYGSGHSQVRVPSLKRPDKTWRNFYKMFPKYLELLNQALAGEIHCIKGAGWIGVEIPDTTHCWRVTVKEDSWNPGHLKQVNEHIHDNFVKLKILK